jgi:threonine dehydratase
MRAMGANVRLVGRDMDAAKAEARAWAEKQGVAFVEDGRETAITEGAGTIGRELLARDEAFDAVLVAVGNGALVNGVGRWIKAASPATEIIGVSAAGAPAMERSWRNGPSGPIAETESVSTIADGVAVRVPVPEAVHDMFGVVDDMVLVDDDSIRTAMELAQDQAGLISEPSGALGVAALLANKARFLGRRVATILCGGNTSR